MASASAPAVPASEAALVEGEPKVVAHVLVLGQARFSSLAVSPKQESFFEDIASSKVGKKLNLDADFMVAYRVDEDDNKRIQAEDARNEEQVQRTGKKLYDDERIADGDYIVVIPLPPPAHGGAGSGGATVEASVPPAAKRRRLVESNEGKPTTKSFSKVSMGEVLEIYNSLGVKERGRLELPLSVVTEAASVNLPPGLPYVWKAKEKEPDATTALVTILSDLLDHTVLDTRTLQLPSVSTEACEYHGYADAVVLPSGFYEGTAFVLQHAAVLLEFKHPTIFAAASQHMPQSLLELLVSKKPVFTTDMATGFKAWILEGEVFRPFHKTVLTLAEGIALIRYFVRKADEQEDAAEAAAASSPATASRAASWTGRQRRASVSSISDAEGKDDDGPPRTYEEYKMRAHFYAQVLKCNGVDVPDELLARLG